MMGSTRLVSFLGLGREQPDGRRGYTRGRYGLEGGSASGEVELVQAALRQLFPAVTSAAVIATPEARAQWVDSGRFREEVGLQPEVFDVDSGGTPEQRWAIFEQCRAALSPERFAAEAVPPSAVILDVTHGFRLQPLLGSAALGFLLSDLKRRRQGVQTSYRVVYGAFEVQGEPKPIWDLTELVLAAEWNAALDAFLRFGRADDLSAIAEREYRGAVATARQAGVESYQLQPYSALGKLGRACKALADDLALARLDWTLTESAPALSRLLASGDLSAWFERLPVLRGAFEDLRERILVLGAERIASPDGLRALAGLAAHYLRIERFSELATTLREGLVLHHALTRGDGKALGERGFSDWLREEERAWSSSWKAQVDGRSDEVASEVADNAALSARIADRRNDILHGGLRADRWRAGKLRELLEGAVDDFATLVRDPPRRQRPPSAGTGFLNLSNHPVAEWTAAQLEAARALGFGEPTDPESALEPVDPHEGTGQLVRRARDLAVNAAARGFRAAYAAGDPTFTAALVRELQTAGIRCFATTSPREVHDTSTGEDGGVEVRRTFRFAVWREYPNLSAEHE